MRVRLPNLFSVNLTDSFGNVIQQIAEPRQWIEADFANYETNSFKGRIIILADDDRVLLTDSPQKTLSFTKAILFPKTLDFTPNGDEVDLSACMWLRHPRLTRPEPDFPVLVSDTIKSWANSFTYLKEDETNLIAGLREPQWGAVQAINAHWAVTSDTATVVMPTGTGKTETMLSVLVANQCARLLVIVPTDALRTQIADKFLTLGVLKEFGIVLPLASLPIVGILRHKPKTSQDVDEFFGRCNVIVTTSQIAGQADVEIQKRIAFHCSELFIDEAHHVSATTWRNFKQQFADKRILQFTATPFREDDKPVEGKIIFKYPLHKAQSMGYFSKINFKPVRVFAKKKRDEAIAELAVQQLREDIQTYRHILMARVNRIDRAKEVFAIYQEKYPEFNPVQIHTGITSKRERDEIRKKLLSGESKIVVCVDMLGEGFDMPELKIAAFHDIRQSPTVTIQLAGRFTRPRADLGDATFIANTGDKDVREELKKLYTQDPDWNFLLPQLSEELIQEQLDLTSFAEGFTDFPKDVPIQSLAPALSTVIYKTSCEEWTPENFVKGLTGVDSFEHKIHAINEETHTLVIITARKMPVEWTKIEKIFNWDWNLYVVYWDKAQSLLFINNSTNSSEFKKLAKAVAGDDVELIKGNDIFRAFGNVYRIVLNNVGLNEHLGKLVSYTGRMGSNVAPTLTAPIRHRSSKSVLAGIGFENGERTSLGCSAKGRVWAHARAFQLNKLIEWCSHIGRKVLDTTIDPNDYLINTLVSEEVSERPATMPFSVDWHRDIYKDSEAVFSFLFEDGTECYLYEVDLKLINPDINGAITFEVVSDESSTQFSLTLKEENGRSDFDISSADGKSVSVKYRGNISGAVEFFKAFPPVVWFVDGSELCGNTYTPLRKSHPPYSQNDIQVWDWTGINIRQESQGIAKTPNTIQHYVIQALINRDFDIVFDDDSSGEAADAVAIKVVDAADNRKVIRIELYHCKFSTENTPGARVNELYELCGQTQRSVHWMQDPSELFLHLLRREEKRFSETGVSRIDKGDFDKLHEIMEMSSLYKTEISIFAVQPGLSKSRVSSSQLELLGVTESYLKETYLIPFAIIASP